MTAGPDDTAATLLDAEQAARVAHVPAATFRYWTAEGRVTACATADDGRRLYREADVLNAEAATRRRPRTARLLTEALHDLAARVDS